MQGQKSALGSFTETVDLNQESLPNNSSMDRATAWNNGLNPAESLLPHNSRGFSGWDWGESSSSANMQDQVSTEGSKMEHGWTSSYNTCATTETRLNEHLFEPPNILRRDRNNNGFGSNQIAWGPVNVQSSGSDHFPLNVNLNARYSLNDDDDEHGVGEEGKFQSFCKSGRLDTEQFPSAGMSSGDVGTSSGNSGHFAEHDQGSGSSLGSWGLSCKRKALEGTSALPYPGGNASFSPQSENIFPQNIPARHNASSSLSISSSAVNSPVIVHSEQLTPRFGFGMRGVASDVFPPSSVMGTAENSTRNFGARTNLAHQDPAPFSIQPSGSALRRSSARSSHQSSRSISFSDSFEFVPTASLPSNSSNTSNQHHLMHGPGLGPSPSQTRNMPFNWNGALSSRSGGSSSSHTFQGERGIGFHEDAGFRSNIRNNPEHPMFFPSSETRNVVQDPTNWSLATGNSSTPGGAASSSRAGPSSSSRSFPTAWLPHHSRAVQNQIRLSDFAPWALSPAGESEAGVPRAHLSPFASGPSSSPEETLMSAGANSQVQHQPYSRSGLLMEFQGDEANIWRSLVADIDGRQRLVAEIRQVLNAMRRGENLRAEDYMLFDPFINGMAELHDRHRDMRLDVDNMSYEELLALEERIGNVNTGLNEETIMLYLTQRKFLPFMIKASSKLEPCCICQEEYVIGEHIGTLDCGHDFHTNCIKQWLLQKNLCPICKMTGLAT